MGYRSTRRDSNSITPSINSTNMLKPFKEEHSLDKRREVADRIRAKYPDRIPVIVEKAPKSDAPDIDKKKFLVPADITVGKFVYEIMSHIYAKYKDEDGFLYITYSGENTFGQ